MKILFVGDVFGKTGRNYVNELMPKLRAKLNIDFIVVNGENSAHGFGIVPKIYNAFVEHGADVITLGNHTFDKKEIFPFLTEKDNLIRPLNYDKSAIGKGWCIITHESGVRIAVVQLIGQVYMKSVDSPFESIQNWLTQHKKGTDYDILIVDFHAEATAEKVGMGHYLDGHASLVVGTHTHVPTADAHILPLGTGYITDIGMSGDYDSVIGSQKHLAMKRFTDKSPHLRLEPAENHPTFCGIVADIDEKTGKTTQIFPIRIGSLLENTHDL